MARRVSGTSESMGKSHVEHVIGIDVGGTKIAAGLVRIKDGRVLAHRHAPTLPARGGQAVLDDVISIARSLQGESRQLSAPVSAIGVGIAELVSPRGELLSAATIDWRPLNPANAIHRATGLEAWFEADVRAAALAESMYGAGREQNVFLYVTVGTGISATLVQDGLPYAGARGLTGTFASSPMFMPNLDDKLEFGPTLEEYASGLGLPARLRRVRPSFTGDARDVMRMGNEGDAEAQLVVTTGGVALGRSVGNLVNCLDPGTVVLGGGLGLAERYLQLIDGAMRQQVWSQLHREIPLAAAQLGVDAGLIGAAASAIVVGRLLR